jgi:hypothetical protein
MTIVNLAEVARARRVSALASLAKQEDTLFDISKQRGRARRTTATGFFRSNRASSTGNVISIDILKKAA